MPHRLKTIQLAAARLHYSERGYSERGYSERGYSEQSHSAQSDGLPLIGLHGAGVDHREVEAALEAMLPGSGLRRIYPDLPGMGRSTADGLNGNDDVVALLVRFIDQVAAGPVLLLGHSYGAYLARGVAARYPEKVLGLALICPVGEQSADLPAHEVVQQDADHGLEPELRAGFEEYFVVRTSATARRYRDAVVPGTKLADSEAIGRVFGGWSIQLGPAVFAGPTLIVAGRQDSTAGVVGPTELVEHYPGAVLAVVDGAGHALMHERPDQLGPLLTDWIERARLSAARAAPWSGPPDTGRPAL